MSFVVSKSVVLIDSLNEGIPGPEHFRIEETQFDLTKAKDELEADGVIVQLLVISADPYVRNLIRNDRPTTITPGTPMRGFVGGKILASKNVDWKEGDLFGGNLAFSTYQVLNKQQLQLGGFRNLSHLIDESQISLSIGVLGMPGSTSYGGLLGILKPKEGETIFVSAAAGAVGGIVGMLAKQLFHCTVIGSCGGEAKCAFVKERYGFDHVIDYKTVHNKEELVAALRQVAPQGIDMYFENVGGIHFQAALEVLRPFGRIAVCGGISEYNEKNPQGIVFDPLRLIYAQQRIEGFLCTRWLTGQEGSFLQDMSTWLKEDKITVQETTFEGVDQWPVAFRSLFTGANYGKVVVRV